MSSLHVNISFGEQIKKWKKPPIFIFSSELVWGGGAEFQANSTIKELIEPGASTLLLSITSPHALFLTS